MAAVHRGMQKIAEFIQKLASIRAAQHDSVLAKVFRGHANREWPLRPSAYRAGGEKGIINEAALERWIRTAGPVVPSWPQNQIEWLALAQHHGVATGLLDWTFNPLIALFFASEMNFDNGDRSDQPGCVWILDTLECDQFTHTLMVDPFAVDRTKPAFLPVLGANLRAKSQFGAMTLHSPPLGDEEIVFPNECARQIFVVEPNDKSPVRKALGVLGINNRTVFINLDAAAEEFRNRAVSFRK
ncbi:MAG: FRG domain-containing protein [Hyphomonadaceae bacterium]